MNEKSKTELIGLPVKRRRLCMVAVYCGIIVLLAVGFAGWVTHGIIRSTHLQASVAIDVPFEISLSQRLLTIPLDKIQITPHIEGEWSTGKSLTHGDRLRFTPRKPFTPETSYVITFRDVRRFTGIVAEIPQVSFRTEAAPGVAHVSFRDNDIIPADAALSVALSAKNRGLRDLRLKTEPELPMSMTTHDDTTFSWRANELLPQGKELRITVTDAKSNVILVSSKVSIAAEPILASGPPEMNFGKNDTVKLMFAQPIDPKSGVIAFSVEGSGSWQDDKTYYFVPKEVAPGKTYVYQLPKGLRSKEGGILTEARDYKFSTPGVVQAIAFSPHGQELSQARQIIRIGFNQPVDKQSAEAHTSVSHGTITGRSWEGDTLLLTGTGFGAQQTVRVSVAAGIKPIFGLPSTQAYIHTFTTETPVTKLAVPMHYQQYAQSCEAASLRMALSYRGIQDNDWNILQRFGYNPRPLDQAKNEWDDPQQQFVGDVKGNQGKGTGWGVYAEPVAKATREYGRAADVQYGVTASFVAQNIHQGNPVILWGIWNESAIQKTWKTPSGRTVSGPVPMHVRLVVGVKGRADRPVGFYIHDPITGPTYWTAEYMVYNAQRAGAANMAVAVQ
jgi:uncharacterized protein YvpB